jgi:hypothetical protein
MIRCPYCREPAERVLGLAIYPHRPDLAGRVFFRCRPCQAYVGTHRATGLPLGTLANLETRRARRDCHAVFDPMWKLGYVSRGHAYRLLAERLGMTSAQCHISHWQADECRRALPVIAALRDEVARTKETTQ